MSVKKGKSFAINIRPKSGIIENGVLEGKLLSYFDKFEFKAIAFEKTGSERHLHAQVWLNTPKSKGDLMKEIRNRICMKYIQDWDENHKKYCVIINFAYSDWFETYVSDNQLKIETDENGDIYIDDTPINTEIYYPTLQEQEEFQKHKFNQKWMNLKNEFFESEFYKENFKIYDVAKFMSWMANVEGRYQLHSDKRVRVNETKALFMFSKGKVMANEFLTNDDFIIYQADMKFEQNHLKNEKNSNIINNIELTSQHAIAEDLNL